MECYSFVMLEVSEVTKLAMWDYILSSRDPTSGIILCMVMVGLGRTYTHLDYSTKLLMRQSNGKYKISNTEARIGVSPT